MEEPAIMADVFKAHKVSEKVYWVGAIDWGLREFHGYATPRGTTYNAFLVLAEKVTLVDTVKRPFVDEMFARVADVIEPSKIDYIISNHAEMDHTGGLPITIDRVGPEKVFASTMGAKALEEHFHFGYPIEPVRDGQTLNLGDMDVTFMETRMLHWPDSMMSYLAQAKILFSQDGFGMHLASSRRYDDELDLALLEWEAAKYYANILMPYAQMVEQLYGRLKSFDRPIDLIAPDHGPMWRKHIGWIADHYHRWAKREAKAKAVVTFDTMWHSTQLMADAVAEGLADAGLAVKVMPLAGSHRSDVATEVLDAAALLVGTPTINSQMFPTVADVLCYLRGLRPAGLTGAAFGSYGWGTGAGVDQVQAILADMKVELAAEPLKVKYVPDAEALARCRELGLTVGRKALQSL